jgi:hypothetical protein
VEFEVVVTAEQARCYKPNSAIFEEALRRLAVEPRSPKLRFHVPSGSAARPSGSPEWRSARLLTEPPDFEVPDLKSLLAYMDADA